MLLAVLLIAGFFFVSMQTRSLVPSRLQSLAEIGYTRKGSGFGKGSTGPECIVTGGFGSMKVSFKGQEYYVCCTGCRDLFNDNPEAVLAEYKQRKAEKNKGK